MGLDMYLEKRHYIPNYFGIKEEDKYKIEITKGGREVPYINPDKITNITEECIYWRKANAIHLWFIDNCAEGNNDNEMHVTPDKLEELLDIINKVLENTREASELLPTTSGFFFGDTNYGEYYFETLKDTKKQLEELMESTNWENQDYYYIASW